MPTASQHIDVANLASLPESSAAGTLKPLHQKVKRCVRVANGLWKLECISDLRKVGAKTKQLIWRGSAEGTLSNNAEKNEKNLDEGVAKMFKKFPSQAAKG